MDNPIAPGLTLTGTVGNHMLSIVAALNKSFEVTGGDGDGDDHLGWHRPR